jgi:hypothetical protein
MCDSMPHATHLRGLGAQEPHDRARGADVGLEHEVELEGGRQVVARRGGLDPQLHQLRAQLVLLVRASLQGVDRGNRGHRGKRGHPFRGEQSQAAHARARQGTPTTGRSSQPPDARRRRQHAGRRRTPGAHGQQTDSSRQQDAPARPSPAAPRGAHCPSPCPSPARCR